MREYTNREIRAMAAANIEREKIKRYALVTSRTTLEQLPAYMPANYEAIWTGEDAARPGEKAPSYLAVIAGHDVAGWTLDDYVIPRLASGLYFANEIDLSHPVMKRVSV